MKASLLFFSFCVFLPAAGLCDECAKSPDACAPPARVTPFIAELKKAAAPAAAAPAGKKETAEAPARRTQPRPPAAPQPAAAIAPAPQPEAAPAAGKKEILSKPGWLAAVILFLCGLYYFLKEGKKRKARK